MANTLLLNQTQVFNGLGTLTYTVPVGTATQLYSVQVQTSFPQAVPQNAVWNGNTAGMGSNNPIGNAIGAGSGSGLGSGTGGGGQGFILGDRGLGFGGVGQGFGTGNNYQQPPSAGSNVLPNSYVQSSLLIVVNKNGVAQFTSTLPTQSQGALQFKTNSFSAAASDVITVVLSSSASVDNQLSGITSNVSVAQGL